MKYKTINEDLILRFIGGASVSLWNYRSRMAPSHRKDEILSCL